MSGGHFFSAIWKIFDFVNVFIGQNAVASKQNANLMLSANLAHATICDAKFPCGLLN